MKMWLKVRIGLSLLLLLLELCNCVEVLSDGPRIAESAHLNDAAKKSAFDAFSKRGGDADVPKCIENFDIHKDKIIRTTDSRAMGAKYLNEMDLDTREECLRLCCETENCDVFVYEEKNAGSCYLFQCGPPEDFKCKFTHHVNYTSAINRHLLDLESQIKLTKHEQELTKLRKPEIANAANVDTVVYQPPTKPTKPTKPPLTTSKPTTFASQVQDARRTEAPPTTSNKRCSPYQFECRSTAECIAIYNACDGIPQCADGSDEGPELKCPDSTTPTPIAPLRPAKIVSSAVQITQPNIPQNRMYRPSIMQNLAPKQPGDVQQAADFLRPVADPMNPLHGTQYEPQQSGAQYQYIPSGQSNWEHSMPQQQEPIQPQHLNQYNKNSHIFNHKENGLQVPDISETRYNNNKFYKGAMQTLHHALGYSNPSTGQMQYAPDVRESQRLPNYYNEIYNQQFPQMPAQMTENNWPNNNNNQPDFRTNGVYQEVNPNGRETWNQANVPMLKTDTNSVIYNKPATKELIPASEEKELSKHEQEKAANDLKKSKEHFANDTPLSDGYPATKPAKNDNENKNSAHAKYHTEYKIAAEAFEAIEDGIAETPSGAVLSLTLGLTLTAFMAVLIGCRLRVVRRRLRRGGKSYAHDADYLVNGMYL